MLDRKLCKILLQIMGDPFQRVIEIQPLFFRHAITAVSQCGIDPGTDLFDYSIAFFCQIIQCAVGTFMFRQLAGHQPLGTQLA